jgi:hypothetical protein
MLSEFRSIFRLCSTSLKQPGLIKRATRDPFWPVLAIRAHWKLYKTEINQFEFISCLTQNIDTDIIANVYTELKSNISLYEHLRKCTKAIGNFSEDYSEMETIYVIVRIRKPDIVVETGVASGVTSSFILQALEDNDQGELHSIDLPPTGRRLANGLTYHIPSGKQSGWMIPDSLRHRWHLILGESAKELLPLLQQLGNIDIFLHDSLHTFENMRFEYEAAWPFITKDGILLSHDVTHPYLEFCRKVDSIPVNYRRLGGVLKQ